MEGGGEGKTFHYMAVSDSKYQDRNIDIVVYQQVALNLSHSVDTDIFLLQLYYSDKSLQYLQKHTQCICLIIIIYQQHKRTLN